MTSAHDRNELRLATLLRLRALTRDERRTLLAAAHRDDEELVRRLTRLGGQQQRLRDDCRHAAGPGEIDIDRLVAAHRCAVGLQARERELREQRQSLAGEIERRRQSLVEADQEVQILEKLQDRRHQAQRLDAERQEAKQLDEAALRTVTSANADSVTAGTQRI
jgi:flagellar export protein FliJ